MPNIIDVTHRIGVEVTATLENSSSDLYYQETVLLYSLVENLLKFLVATKDCWDETCRKVDKAVIKEKKTGKTVPDEELKVDFEVLRSNAKELNFNNTINRACSLKLITEEQKKKLHTFRDERNNLVHQLYLFDNRNNPTIMRGKLLEAEAITKELIDIFEDLLYDQIGFSSDDLPSVFEVL